MAGGFASGLVLGLIGTGVTYWLAASSGAELSTGDRVLLSQRGASYVQSYESGYAQKLRSKRKRSALVGGLAGTATFLVVVMSASGGS